MTPEQLLEHDDFVRALARGVLFFDDASSSDDVAQQAWLNTLRAEERPASSAGGALRAFLARCVERVAIDFSRSSRARARREREAARVDVVPSPEQIVAREEARRRVIDALLRLDETSRDVILLRYYEDLPPRRIAATLGVPVETVRTRLKRGLHRLRAEMDREYGGDGRSFAVALLPLVPIDGVSASAALYSGVAAVKLTVSAIAIALVAAVIFFMQGSGDPPALVSSHSNPSVVPVDVDSSSGAAARGTKSESPLDRKAEQGASENADRAAATVPSRTIRGRVVDPRDNPVADVELKLVSDDDSFGSRGGLAHAREAGIARSGTDGSFAFTGSLEASDYAILAKKTGYALLDESPVKPGDVLTLRLDRPRQVEGLVVDELGKPVASASIHWFGVLGRSTIDLEATSDAAGRFALLGFPAQLEAGENRRGELGMLQVEATGYAPLLYEMKQDDSGANVDLTLVVHHGASVIGVVVDAGTGKPIAGADVWFESSLGADLVERPFERPRVAPWRGERFGATKSDEKGEFTITGIPSLGFHEVPANTFTTAGAISGYVIATLGPNYGRDASMIVLPARGETKKVKLELSGVASVEGRVVDSMGKPVVGALVAANYNFAAPYDWHWAESPPGYVEVAHTGEDGSYRLHSVPAKRADGDKESPAIKLFTQRPYSYREATVDVVVVPGKSVTAPDLVLDADSAILLRVVDREGKPIEHARAASVAEKAYARAADRDGRIVLAMRVEQDDAKPVHVDAIRVLAEGFVTQDIGPFDVAPDAPAESERTVVLERAEVLHGVVRFIDGSPAAYAKVRALAPETPIGAAFVDLDALMELRRASQFPALYEFDSTRADSLGRFTLRALPASGSSIVAGGEGFDERSGANEFVTVAATSIVPSSVAIELVLPLPGPRSKDRVIEGTASDASTGAPLFEFNVDFIQNGLWRPVERYAPGRFRIVGLEPGVYRVRARAPGHRGIDLEHVEIPKDHNAPPIVLAFEVGVVARGRVVAPQGANFTGAMIQFRSEKGESTEMTKVVDGRYEVAGLAPGRWRPFIRFSIRYQGMKSYTVAADRILVIGSGQKDAIFDIEAILGGSLIFELTDPRLPPVSWMKKPATPDQIAFASRCRLVVEDTKGVPFAVNESLTAPTQEWFDLPAGDYRVRVKLGDDPEIVKNVTIAAGHDETMNIGF